MPGPVHETRPTTETKVIKNRLQFGVWTLLAGAIATGVLLAQTLLLGHQGLGVLAIVLALVTLVTLPLLGIATHSHAR